MTVIDTPAGIQMMRLVTMQQALCFDIDHADSGMTLTRVKYLGTMQREGLTNKRTKRGALRDLNGYFVANGMPEKVKWSKVHPDDKPTKWVEVEDVNTGEKWWEPKR